MEPLEDIDDITYAISTVPRKQGYLDSTLKSAGPDITFSLFIGMPDFSYVMKYKGIHNLYITSSIEWLSMHEWDIARKASYNYWRCLQYGRRTKGGLIVFEDDIEFAKGWQKRFSKALKASSALFGDNFIITLYVHSPMFKKGFYHGNVYEIYEPTAFFGTQAVYFTDRTRYLFSEYLKKNAVEVKGLPYDMQLKDFCYSKGVRLIATTPSLIQHIGKESTGLGEFHQAEIYVPVLPEATQ